VGHGDSLVGAGWGGVGGATVEAPKCVLFGPAQVGQHAFCAQVGAVGHVPNGLVWVGGIWQS